MAESSKYIALGKDGKYLRYVLEDGESHSRMQFTSDNVMGDDKSFTKLEIVISAQSSFEQVVPLVHIRSCYNNKFFVLSAEDENWIVAGADEPEEDFSKWSCTVFRFYGFQNTTWLSFIAANHEHCVHVDRTTKSLTAVRNSSSIVIFDVTDLASLPLLPRYVVFKGDNNRYLAARPILAHKRLRFNMSDPLNQRAHHEVVTLPNGNIRLRSLTYDRYWIRSNHSFIFSESNDPTADNAHTVFQPLRLDTKGHNTVALKNKANSKYCERNTTRGPRKLKSTLRATANTVNPKAVLRVEEAVRDRQIYNVQYNINDARIYDVTPLNDIDIVTNTSQTNTVTKQLEFTYTKMSEATFTSTQSWKLKSSITIKAQIPLLVQGKIRLDTTYKGSIQWSETKEESEEIKSFVTVNVPPMTKVKVTMVIHKGSIDVPFSYTQRDTLLNEKVVTTRMHDGLFSGLNTDMVSYNFEQEELSEEEARAAALLSKL